MVLAQGSVRGKVLDKQTDESMEFVNVVVETPAGKLVKGAITDVDGHFNITGLQDGTYRLQVTFVGYKTLTRQFTLTPQNRQQHYNALYISEDAKVLGEVQVTGQRSQMKLEVDRKVFSVDQILAAAGGSASDLLENIPSVEVTTDGEISLRGNSSVEVWINGKASGLTSDNRAEILQQIPAESCVPVPTSMADGTPAVISTTPAAYSTLLPTSASVTVRTREAARATSTISRPTSISATIAKARTGATTFLHVSD